LKNIAEQISVLSTDKNITAKELLQFLPENNLNRLPVLAGGKDGVSQQEFANEREILYKLFFDMKKDVNELKKMFFDVFQNSNGSQHIPVYNNNNDAQLADITPVTSANNFSQPGQRNH
jgi:hypothetical protein